MMVFVIFMVINIYMLYYYYYFDMDEASNVYFLWTYGVCLIL